MIMRSWIADFLFISLEQVMRNEVINMSRARDKEKIWTSWVGYSIAGRIIRWEYLRRHDHEKLFTMQNPRRDNGCMVLSHIETKLKKNEQKKKWFNLLRLVLSPNELIMTVFKHRQTPSVFGIGLFPARGSLVQYSANSQNISGKSNLCSLGQS